MPHPVSIRLGNRKTSIRRAHPIVAELEARGDSLAATIARDLGHWYQSVDAICASLNVQWHTARIWYAWFERGDFPTYTRDLGWTIPTQLAITDALERAHRLVTQGSSIDAALTTVGLIAKEQAS